MRGRRRPMLVMIDNYDSFTHNLVRYFHELGQQVMVFRNDAVTIEQIRALEPSALIISPGPGTPDDAGVSLAAIEAFADTLPILGVCLGHQAIAQVYGADVVRAQQVMHGKTTQIRHTDAGLFTSLPREFRVTRYHSLLVANHSMPSALEVDAVTADANEAAIMAIRDPHRSVFGIQFHPESVLTEHGYHLLGHFCQHAGLNAERNAEQEVQANLCELSQSLR